MYYNPELTQSSPGTLCQHLASFHRCKMELTMLNYPLYLLNRVKAGDVMTI